MTALLEAYLSIRTQTEHICATHKTEDYGLQAAIFVSPTKWHLAHTTWFFEQMILLDFADNYKVYDSQFNFLFNSYYNTIGERVQRDQRGLISRPSVEEVYSYRKHVDAEMSKLLQFEVSSEVKDLVILGLNHEQQHQELMLTDIKYNLYQNPTYPALFEQSEDETQTKRNWLKIDEGVYEIGHNDASSFCFDNELGVHKVYLHKFEIASNLVANGEYLDFINSEGYKKHNYWLDEGWAWVNLHQKEAPLYWKQIDNQWYAYTLTGMKPIKPDDPVTHISFYEANAYANYVGMRLPTEFEWEIASKQFHWGQRWEWTNSAYLPYPNFKISEGAVGEYNGKFMINQMVLRGASGATAKGHSRHTYRNFFHPEAQWQFTGIRLVK